MAQKAVTLRLSASGGQKELMASCRQRSSPPSGSPLTALFFLVFLLPALCDARGTRYLPNIDISTFASAVQLAVDPQNPTEFLDTDVFVGTCTRFVASRTGVWDGAFQIPLAQGANQVAQLITITGDSHFDKPVSGMTFDGLHISVLFGNALLVRYAWNAAANALVQAAALVLPTGTSAALPTPLTFPSEACTVCAPVTGGVLPVIIGRYTAWPIIQSTMGSGDMTLGTRILNIAGPIDSPCSLPALPPTPVGYSFPSPHATCVRDIMHTARFVNTVDGQYRLFFQMSGQSYLYEATGNVGTAQPIDQLKIIATLAHPTGEYDSRRLVGIHTCKYYIWPDDRSADLFAINTGVQPLDIPFRLVALATQLPHGLGLQSSLAAFGAGSDLYLSGVTNNGFIVRLDGTSVAAALDGLVPAYVNECTINNGGCVASGGHVCVPDEFGVASCVCPAGQDSRPFGCVDLDECALDFHTCQAPSTTCVNRAGGYDCRCAVGYSSQTMLAPCERADVCGSEQNQCEPPSVCSTTQTGIECLCPQGMVLQANTRCIPTIFDANIGWTGTPDITGLSSGSSNPAITINALPNQALTSTLTLTINPNSPVSRLYLSFVGSPLTLSASFPANTPLLRITGPVDLILFNGLRLTATTTNTLTLFASDNGVSTLVVTDAIISLPAGSLLVDPPPARIWLSETTIVGATVAPAP